MSNLVEWSDLPEDLVDEISNHLFSNVELLRLRNICKSWRSAIATKKRFPNRNRKRNLSPYKEKKCDLSPAAFYRVILSSHPDKGWLIKTQDVSKFRRKNLLSPLSRLSMDLRPSQKTLDLVKYTVSEIRKSYDVHCLESSTNKAYNFARVVLVNNLVFVVDYNKQIWWCKSGEENDNVWTRIEDEEVKFFCDIILHKGQLYALDLKGAIWWISLSELNIFQYGPTTPMDDYDIGNCKEKRLVEYCGDLFVIHRFCERICVRKVVIERTNDFKVYKMDEESVSWVEVKSLGDKAFVMATDSCFSVVAREYHGCLENSIYFTDEEGKNNVKVFKLGDRSIMKKVDFFNTHCFEMFSPPFVF